MTRKKTLTNAELSELSEDISGPVGGKSVVVGENHQPPRLTVHSSLSAREELQP